MIKILILNAIKKIISSTVHILHAAKEKVSLFVKNKTLKPLKSILKTAPQTKMEKAILYIKKHMIHPLINKLNATKKKIKNFIDKAIYPIYNRIKISPKLVSNLSPFIRKQFKDRILKVFINRFKSPRVQKLLAEMVEWYYYINVVFWPPIKKNKGEIIEFLMKYKGYFLNKGTNSKITDLLLVELNQELKELNSSFNLKLLALKNNNLSTEENQFSILSLKQEHIKNLSFIEDKKKKILLDDKNFIFEYYRGLDSLIEFSTIIFKIVREFIQTLIDKFIRENVENFSFEFFSRILQLYEEEAPIDYYFSKPLMGAIDNTPFFTPHFLSFPHIPGNKDFEYVKKIASKIVPTFLFRTMDTALNTFTYSAIGTAIAYGAVRATSRFVYNFNPDPLVEQIFRSMTRKYHKPTKKMGRDLVIYDPNVEKIRSKPEADINKEFLKIHKPEGQDNLRRDAEDKFNKKYKDYKKKYNRFDDTFNKPDSPKGSSKFEFNHRNIKEIPLEDVKERVDTAKEFQEDIKRMESAYEYAQNNREDIDEKDFKMIEKAYSFFKDNKENLEWLKRNNPIVDRDDPKYADEWLSDIGAYAQIGFNQFKRDFSEAWRRTWSIHEPSGVKLPRPDKNIDIPFVDDPKNAEEYMKVLESGEIYVREPDEVFKDRPKELEKVTMLAIKRADRILGELNKKRVAAGGKSQTSEEMLSDPDVDRKAEAEHALEPRGDKPEE